MKYVIALPAAALVAAFGAAAHAGPTVDSVKLFATGAAVGAKGPDSVAVANGSVWVQYGNGADSTGVIPGASTIVQYSAATGAIQNKYSISGLVDGLRIDPTNGNVWALQNNDANATVSIINPKTNTVSGPLSYGAPYVYGVNSARGYDDVAFRGSQVFLSYTQPAAAGDPILQRLDQGHNPTGTLTTTNVITAGQTGTLPDTDGLRVAPNGDLIQTAEGDGPGSGSTGLYTTIHNPGMAGQTVTNTLVKDAAGNGVFNMDDVVFTGATAGTLYLTDSSNSGIYAVTVSGLDPSRPLASIGGFNLPGGVLPTDVSKMSEVGIVDPTTGIATPFITGADLPNGFTIGDFVPAPEPGTLALLGAGVMGLLGAARRKRG